VRKGGHQKICEIDVTGSATRLFSRAKPGDF
jgi:hypothetical protein